MHKYLQIRELNLSDGSFYRGPSGIHPKIPKCSLFTTFECFRAPALKMIYCGPNYGAITPFVFICSITPFRLSLSDHSGFPPSLPLILWTSLFCPSFTAAMKKAAVIYIFHHCISGGLMTAIKWKKALEIWKPTVSVSQMMKHMKL